MMAPTFYDGFRDYQKQSKLWIDSMYNELGWELISYILSDSASILVLIILRGWEKYPQ